MKPHMPTSGFSRRDLLVLVVVVILLANLFEADATGPLIVKWLLVAAITAAVASGLRASRRRARGVALHSEGARLQERGRVAEALERFEAARPLPGKLAYLADFSAGQCNLELWRLPEAERALSRIRQEGTPPELLPQIPPRLALVLALQGAEARAREELSLCAALEPEPSPLTLLTQAVLACRREAWGEASRYLSRQEILRLGGTLRGLRDALLSWSRARGGGAAPPAEGVALFAEASTDSLQEAWPELLRFLTERSRRAG